MSPRPAPDLDLRRDQLIHAARDLAEADGWPTVTMRRLAGELGVTQPVLYSAFASRQALVDAVALNGFDEVAAALDAVDASPMARMRAYLDFAAAHPRVYEAMFSLPSGLAFAAISTPSMVPAPSLFSTTTVCPRLRCSFSPIIRASTSAGPPAENGTISRTGLVG